jgi:hypothetical protein
MKYKWMSLLATGTLVCGLAIAQQETAKDIDPAAPPPIPPKVPGEEIEPSVTITEREGQRIEEYSMGSRIYMIKITPNIGLPYFLMDTDGDGSFETTQHELDSGLLIPNWILLEW